MIPLKLSPPVNLLSPFILIALLPLSGLILVIIDFKKGYKYNILLSMGEKTYGKLIKIDLPIDNNAKEREYSMTFTFKSIDGIEYQVEEKTYNAIAISDDEKELLLYQPDDPSYAVLFERTFRFWLKCFAFVSPWIRL